MAGSGTTATLALLGDIMLGRLVSDEIARRPPEYVWGTTRPLLQAADAVLGNLECAITTHGTPWSRTSKVFHFGALPRAIDVLRAGNVRYVSLANNHILDFEEPGLADTIAHLDRAGILHAGAGADRVAATAPAMLNAAGLDIGIISLTDNEPPFAAGTDRPGTYYTPIGTGPEVLGPIDRAIAALRAVGAGLIVLSVHWGPNMVTEPPDHFRAFAHAVVDLGVDILHGHSAHLFQGVEVRNGRLILYDTGDFIDDYAVDHHLRNDWSFVFLVEADATGPVRLRMAPARLDFAEVNLATGREFDAICDRMDSRCKPFGTQLNRTELGPELQIRPATQ
jgi:poly-gamma-glutamate synthesis protein (capsule biosynthesis protein)